MPEAFVQGLDAQTRTRMTDVLNATLADTVALTLAVKQAHWNLRGRGFIGVHEMLDDVAARLRESADLMAERAVILGGHAKGTVEEAAKETNLKPYPNDLVEIEEHVGALRDRFETLGARLRKAIEASAEAGDEATSDLFTEVVRAVDKDAWFIGANVPESPERRD